MAGKKDKQSRKELINKLRAGNTLYTINADRIPGVCIELDETEARHCSLLAPTNPYSDAVRSHLIGAIIISRPKGSRALQERGVLPHVRKHE